MIAILNRRYEIKPEKSISDLTDWEFRSIWGKVTNKEIEEIFSSEEFFEEVKVKEGFKEFYEKMKDEFEFYIVTKGTIENLKRKKKFFAEELGEGFEMIGMPLWYDEQYGEWMSGDGNKPAYSKSRVDMRGGIQIDDRVDSLDSNATVKILIKNWRTFPWNRYRGEYKEHVYILNDWKEIEEVLEFGVKNAEDFFAE